MMRDLLARFLYSPRWSLARYGVAGVAVSLGYTLTIILLVEVVGGVSPTVASLVSFVLWAPASYVVHRDFTFRSAEASPLHSRLKFGITFVLRFVLSGFAVWLVSDYLHWHYLFGVLVNWILLPVAGYLVMLFWVFEGWERRSEAARTADARGQR